MIPLYHDPHLTFRFAEDRVIARFHLEGVPHGRRVTVYRLDPATGNRLDLLAIAITGPDGWVDLREPIVVRLGEGFIAVPDSQPEPPANLASPACEAPPGHCDENDPPAPPI